MKKSKFLIKSGIIILITILISAKFSYGQNPDTILVKNVMCDQFKFKCSVFSAGAYLQSDDIFVARDINFTYNGVTIKAPLILCYTETGKFQTLCSGTIYQDSIKIIATNHMGYSYSADKIEMQDHMLVLKGHAKLFKSSIDSYEANEIKVTYLD